MCDGCFNYFPQKLHLRCLKGFWIRRVQQWIGNNFKPFDLRRSYIQKHYTLKILRKQDLTKRVFLQTSGRKWHTEKNKTNSRQQHILYGDITWKIDPIFSYEIYFITTAFGMKVYLSWILWFGENRSEKIDISYPENELKRQTRSLESHIARFCFSLALCGPVTLLGCFCSKYDHLTYSFPAHPFSTPENIRNLYRFLMFSGSRERV